MTRRTFAVVVAAVLLPTGAIRAQTSYYAIDGQPVASRLGEAVRHGTGPDTLLLIPCASCRWRSFDEFMERNAERYTMFAVTLPGYGGTERPDLPMWSDSTLWRDHAVEALSDLLDDQGVSGAVVIGSSYGTTVAIHLAARRPDVVRGVVNLDGGFTRPVGKDTIPMSARLERAREVMEQYGDPLADPDRWQRFNTPAIVERPDRKLMYHGWFMATDREAMMQYWRENLLDDGNGAFRSLEIPFLDVRAIRPWDETPEETGAAIEATIDSIGPPPGYRRVLLYDTPHFVMEERPALLDRIVADFLAGREIEDFRADEPTSMGADSIPLLMPDSLDFTDTPIEPVELEIRWITEPDSAVADTGYVYMDVSRELVGRKEILAIDWHPYFGDLPNEDVLALDPGTFRILYRTLPMAGGAYGIFWYPPDGPAYGAHVDSLGHARRHEIELERAVFSIPSFPFLLSQLARRRDAPFRIEQVSWRPEDGPTVRQFVVEPGERISYTDPESGSTYDGRAMHVHVDPTRVWTYAVMEEPPYFFWLEAWRGDVKTTRMELARWSRPAIDPSTRVPQLLRQEYIDE